MSDSFYCCSCDTRAVRSTKADGRMFEVVLGKPPLRVPEWLEINTCDTCGEMYLGDLWSKQMREDGLAFT